MRYDPDRVARDVGRRVAELRREREMSQMQIADLLDVSSQWVSQIELGQNVSVRMLARIANALDVQIAMLLEPPVTPRRRPKPGRPRKVREGA